MIGVRHRDDRNCRDDDGDCGGDGDCGDMTTESGGLLTVKSSICFSFFLPSSLG